MTKLCPNDEVKSGFLTLIANGYFSGEAKDPSNQNNDAEFIISIRNMRG